MNPGRPGANAQILRQAPPTRPLAGILLLIVSMWTLNTLDASGKWVLSIGMPLLVFCWVRYLVHFALVLAAVILTQGVRALRSARPGMQCLRAFAMLASTLTFFTALKYLPQAQATAIVFLAPLIMLTAAPLVLKEPARRSRWIAALIGFGGVLIVIRPSAGLDPVGVAAGLATAVLFAAQHLATRLLAGEGATTTIVWGGAIGTLTLSLAMPYALPLAWPALAALTPWQWTVMLSTGLTGALGHFLQIMAYRRAPASLLAPFIYLQITGAAAWGWMIWGQLPDALTWAGIIVICSCGVASSLIEWHRARQRTP